MPLKLSNKRCEEIKRIVTIMFKKYHVSCIPINGFEIAHKMGIIVIPYSSFPTHKRVLLLTKSSDGFCVERDNGQWYIYYNDSKKYGRVNNTIMHEIGHIILDHTQDSELAEKEVKFFAKFALAPPILIHKLKLNNTNEIAKAFDISDEAAYYAYSYYKKWLNITNNKNNYTDYELLLLDLFSFAT